MSETQRALDEAILSHCLSTGPDWGRFDLTPEAVSAACARLAALSGPTSGEHADE